MKNMLHRALLLSAILLTAACSENKSDQASDDAQSVQDNKKTLEENQDLNSPDGHWPTYGGPASGTKYSKLDQINLQNVHKLQQAWTYHTGEISKGTAEVDATNYQVTPILANNKLYMCTPFNRIIALDPASGQEIWAYDPQKPLTGTIHGSHTCRGVSYWQSEDTDERSKFCGKRIYQAMGNATLLAVDADNGKLCPEFGDNGKIDLSKLDNKGHGKLAASSPPAIYKNVVIVGGTIFDNREKDSLDGIVRAFDARTGAEIWSWNPIPEHLSDKTGGANTWAPISIDMDRGWVFLPTGSPSFDVYGVNRTDPIPHGNAVVVLDALTGQLIWSYQTVRHDLWDYDLPAMPVLADIKKDDKVIPAVLQPTKMGFLFVLDRVTGKPLFPVEDRPVPQTDIQGEYSSPTQPFPTLPEPVTSQQMKADDAWGLLYFDKKQCRERLAELRNDGLYTPPSEQGSILHPSFLGGTNWGGVAYDEETGVAVLNASNMVSSIKLLPREHYDPAVHNKPGVHVFDMEGAPYILLREVLLSSLGAPCNPPPWGYLAAIDMKTGETLWKKPFGRVAFGNGWIKSLSSWGAPNQGGPIITKGGLVFIGASLDNMFRAYDIQTGKEVWKASVPAPATATPMTYKYNGRQYVVVAAGGHGGFQTKMSDAIVGFSLAD